MRMAAGIGVAVALLYALYSLAASDFSGRADVDAYIDQTRRSSRASAATS